jgi:hypothetical protein
MQQGQYSGSGGGYGYSSYSTAGYTTGFKKFNGLELIVILLSFVAIVGVGLWGFFAANTRFRDEQRADHINQVIVALDQFYLNSSLQPSRRRYPISVCSNNLNEVDYESTLRLHLTGQRPDLDSHAYISQEDFPRDPWGTYSTVFSQKEVPFRCPNIFPTGPETPKYTDDYPACDFSSQLDYTNCYLFTSSVNGDSYQIGYWSEVNNAFIVFSRFREDFIETSIVTL